MRKVEGAHIEERSQQGTVRLLDVWEDEGGALVSPARILDLQSTSVSREVDVPYRRGRLRKKFP